MNGCSFGLDYSRSKRAGTTPSLLTTVSTLFPAPSLQHVAQGGSTEQPLTWVKDTWASSPHQKLQEIGELVSSYVTLSSLPSTVKDSSE